MTDQQSNDLVAIKLDAERRREIDSVKERMENFLRQQINVENELKLVVKGQDGLKERFEMGVAKTLKELDGKFDAFMIAWGTKQAEDIQRDKTIRDTSDTAKAAHSRIDKFLSWPFVAVCISLLLMAIGFLLRHKGG